MPEASGEAMSKDYIKSLAEDWLNEYKRVWSAYDLMSLIKLLTPPEILFCMSCGKYNKPEDANNLQCPHCGSNMRAQ